jgi:uncharacterized membrane protein YecN with MAPEG domain
MLQAPRQPCKLAAGRGENKAMLLPITLTIAGACALLSVWLGFRVSLLRRKHHVSIGEGGIEAVGIRMRAHANFSEYAPLFLILLGLVEAAGGSSPWLWVVAILFVLGRLAHMFGMERPAPHPLRVGGMAATWLGLLGLGAYALVLAYSKPRESAITYAAADQAAASTLSPTKGFVRLS